MVSITCIFSFWSSVNRYPSFLIYFFRSCSHPSWWNGPIKLLISSQTPVPANIFLDLAKTNYYILLYYFISLYFFLYYILLLDQAKTHLRFCSPPTALLVLQGGLPADEAEHGGRRHGVAPVAHGRCDSPMGDKDLEKRRRSVVRCVWSAGVLGGGPAYPPPSPVSPCIELASFLSILVWIELGKVF